MALTNQLISDTLTKVDARMATLGAEINDQGRMGCSSVENELKLRYLSAGKRVLSNASAISDLTDREVEKIIEGLYFNGDLNDL